MSDLVAKPGAVENWNETRQSMAAHIREHLPKIVESIVEKGEAGEGWACKLLLDISGVEQILRAALSGVGVTDPQNDELSDLERAVLEGVRKLLRRSAMASLETDAITDSKEE